MKETTTFDRTRFPQVSPNRRGWGIGCMQHLNIQIRCFEVAQEQQNVVEIL